MKKSRSLLSYLIILGVIITLGVMFTSGMEENKRIEYSQLLSHIENDKVQVVSIRGTSMIGLFTDSTISISNYPSRYDFETTIGDDFVDTVKTMVAKKTGKDVDTLSVNDFPFKLEYLPPIITPWYVELLPFFLMTVLIFAFYWFMLRQQMGGGGKVASFGKSKATVVEGDKNKITFKDVAGADEEKEELQEVVDFLKNPAVYTELGARIPKGMLLVGPPGTGKTLLAKAVAGEAGVPFFSISGSDFVEMFVGVGASRVRDLFEQAKRNQPAIIFIDEIDAVGRRRGAGLGGGHDEREQTLNQLLVEMDGFTNNEGIIVLAATNRRDILDPALLRPGRFDRQISINYPDLKGRVAILNVHAKNKKFADDVDFENIAKRTPYSTGADLANLMNEAAIMAARKRKKVITQDHMVYALERIQMGPEKRSHEVLQEERKLVAYHEAGHAIVGHYLPKCDDVHLITIIPRGNGAGGFTLSLPEKEFDLHTKKELYQKISMMLGGNAAELLIMNDTSTGASSDLKRATSIARNMITKYGMSDRLGTVYLGSDDEVFVGMDYGHTKAYSEETAAVIDEEVATLLKTCYEQAITILKEHMDMLDRTAMMLLEKETLNRQDFLALLEDDFVMETAKVETTSPEISSENSEEASESVSE